MRKGLLSLSKDKGHTYHGLFEAIDFLTALIFVNHRHRFFFLLQLFAPQLKSFRFQGV